MVAKTFIVTLNGVILAQCPAHICGEYVHTKNEKFEDIT
jgi:hypothetical protein